MRLLGLGIVEQPPTVVIDTYPPLPMPLPPQPPPEGYGYVSCLDHPEIENCVWPTGSVPSTGAVQGPALPPSTGGTTGALEPSIFSKIFGNAESLPQTLMIGALMLFVLMQVGSTVRSLNR